MNKRNINIFGKIFAGPRGLRLSPGINNQASCVGRIMKGKKGDIRNAFSAASKACVTERSHS